MVVSVTTSSSAAALVAPIVMALDGLVIVAGTGVYASPMRITTQPVLSRSR
jgi:hypothetical protein